jgi:altronate dehydratase small subunit
MAGTFFQNTDGSGILLLAPGDNVAVATNELPAGTQREIAGSIVEIKAPVDVGHKFAVRAIAAGDRVVKYGAPIGRATRDIAAGEYVHTHNMTSDYLPTYTLEGGKTYIQGAKQ